MSFKELYAKILSNKSNFDKGYYNCIPFLNFKRLESIIPGIEKECYYLLGASTSVGKSSFLRDLFINNPIRYLEENKQDIKLDILYFSLEESKEKILTSELSKYIFSKFKKKVSSQELMSVGRKNELPQDILGILPLCEEHMNAYNKYVHIFDNITNPTGIFKTVRNFALQIGMYYKKDGTFYSNDVKSKILNGTGFSEEEIKDYGGYKTYHSNHYVLVLVDHVSLLSSEGAENLRETMYKFSSKHCIHFRDKFHFTPVIVQQFANEMEQVQYNFQGKNVEEKLQPTVNSLADNKSSVKDCNVMMGLFNPFRYNITKFKGYDLLRLQNNFRSLHILKNRNGIAGVTIPMFFNGQTGLFNELPKPNNERINRIYDYAQQLQKEFLEKVDD